jgi:formylmethanofuran dehydrogenase subunit E
MDHQAVVEQMLVEILGKLREQSAEIASISARLDRPVAAKEVAAGAACDACGTDITAKARILLADGRIICGMCTQVLASQKIVPQVCGRGSA